MIARDTVELALRNLRQAKLRTALTTMGVSIGIASLAGMVSLGVGLQEQLVSRFLESGLFDVVTVMPQSGPLGRGLPGSGGGGRRMMIQEPARPGTPQDAPSRPLDDTALVAIRALPEVRDASPTIVVPVEVRYGQASEYTTARGIPLSSASDSEFKAPKYGSFFTSDTDHACLLLLDLAKRLTAGDPKDLVGHDLTVSYVSRSGGGLLGLAPMPVQQTVAAYRIVGIVERDSGMGGFGGMAFANVMLPLGVARAIDATVVTGVQQLLRPASTDADPKAYGSATVRVSRMSQTKDVEDRLKRMGFNAFSVADALDAAKRAFIVLDILLSLIGSIALAVSSLGIVNTMVMSILERTREIGIMKAIGGSNADIRRIFLVEASAIGLMGGLAGVFLGWVVGRVINFGANWYIESQGGTTGNLFSLPLWLISGAIAFSWLVSLLAGLYPAARAARLDPIHALRHD